MTVDPPHEKRSSGERRRGKRRRENAPVLLDTRLTVERRHEVRRQSPPEQRP